MKEYLGLLRWRLFRYFRDKGWPTYDCENCIGMIEHGCYCAHEGATAPGVGPFRRHLIYRRIAAFLNPAINTK
jgi:hypothetical protein